MCTGCLSELMERIKPRNPIKIVGILPRETPAPTLGIGPFAEEEEEKPMLNQWEADRPLVFMSFCYSLPIFFAKCSNNIVMIPI